MPGRDGKGKEKWIRSITSKARDRGLAGKLI